MSPSRKSVLKGVWHLLVLVLLLPPTLLPAAPCCGGGARLPGLLLPEDRARMALGVRDAHFRGGEEANQSIVLDGSTVLADRWSLGVRSGVGFAAAQAATAQDVAGTIAFEAMPEWDSHSLFRGVAYLTATVPVGAVSTTDDRTALGGSRGLYQGTLGFAAMKRLRSFDVTLAPQVSFGTPRANLMPPNSPMILLNEYGAGATFSVGYRFEPLRLRAGVRLEPSFSWRERQARGDDGIAIARRTGVNAGLDVSVDLGDSALLLAGLDDSGWLVDAPAPGPVRAVSIALVLRSLR